MGKLEDRTQKYDRRYIPVKRYNHQNGGKLIGRIRDSKNFYYVGDSTTSYGYICSRRGELPFAKIKANAMKGRFKNGLYEFILLVDSNKLDSSELRRLDTLSTNAGCGSIRGSPEYNLAIRIYK